MTRVGDFHAWFPPPPCSGDSSKTNRAWTGEVASLLSCEARSVYLCRCLMARRGLGGCPGGRPRGRQRGAALPEVVGSSQLRARTTSGAGFSKARREVKPLGACGVRVCLRPPRRWHCFPLCFVLLRVVPRLSPPCPPPPSQPTPVAVAFLVRVLPPPPPPPLPPPPTRPSPPPSYRPRPSIAASSCAISAMIAEWASR